MQPVSRLPLNALRVFAAVATHGSMARAAEALNVQPSAVSMQMKSLSDFIGVPLLIKQGRQIQLTAHGERLMPVVLESLERIDQAVKSLRGVGAQQPFKLSVLPSFLHSWLLPRMGAFEVDNPGLSLQIHTSREPVDLLRGEADAAVRLGGGNWPGLTAEKLMDEWLAPVCSPAMARRLGRLRPGKLPPGVKLLHGGVDRWSAWTGGEPEYRAPGLVIDDAQALVGAAQAGQGLALARWSLVCDAVAAGQLVAVGDPLPYRYAFYWVQAARGEPEPQALQVRDWLKAIVAASCGAMPGSTEHH